MRISDWSSDVCSSDLARDQLARTERLGDIIVGAGLQPADAILFLAACRQHDDRDVRRLRVAAQTPADFDPRQALDHPVEQDDIGDAFLDEDQRLFAVRGLADRETFAREMPDDEFGDRSEEHTSELQSLMRSSYA